MKEPAAAVAGPRKERTAELANDSLERTAAIALVTPAGPTRRTGNRISGGRWGRILRASGHRVRTLDRYDREPCDLLIALHARRSHESVRRFRQVHPHRPVIVVLTGTDLYHDIHVNEDAQESLRLASRLVVLQRQGLRELSPALRRKTRVIYQSASPCTPRPGNRRRAFTVSVSGHMRTEKDPFRTAMAVRGLPSSSRIRVLHMGAALSEDMERRARREEERNPRYRWLGELLHWQARQMLARGHLLSITSRMEGSSNVLCEALASGVPVAASKIPGLVGTLGEDYPGYFELGDTAGLRRLLLRAEGDPEFYRSLARHCAKAAPLVLPEREVQAWRRLVDEVAEG